MAGSGYFEDWPGTRVQLYIEHGIKAFGEVVSAVRVRPFKPKAQQKIPVPPCADCGGQIQAAMGKTAEFLAAYTTKNYGVPLCAKCAAHRKMRDSEEEQGDGEQEGSEQNDSEQKADESVEAEATEGNS